MKELLFSVTKKDLKITYYSGTGAGGQHRNKCKNSVRIQHKESGVIVTGQEKRSLKQNFKIWLKIKASEMTMDIEKREIKNKVDEMMKPENLKIEYFNPA